MASTFQKLFFITIPKLLDSVEKKIDKKNHDLSKCRQYLELLERKGRL